MGLQDGYEYTTWTQSTGELWQQVIDIGDVTNPDVPLWMQYIHPPVSQAAMLQQLDTEIGVIQQSGAATNQSVTQQTVSSINITEQSLVALMCYYVTLSISVRAESPACRESHLG